MTIEEAIKHCEEVANDRAGCCEDCAEEHRQLAEWLKELKQYREQTDGDLISRKDLLKELEKWDWQELYLPIHFAELVDDLPSAEKTAEWRALKNVYECSNCGVITIQKDKRNYEYCPKCKARMKEVEQ